MAKYVYKRYTVNKTYKKENVSSTTHDFGKYAFSSIAASSYTFSSSSGRFTIPPLDVTISTKNSSQGVRPPVDGGYYYLPLVGIPKDNTDYTMSEVVMRKYSQYELNGASTNNFIETDFIAEFGWEATDDWMRIRIYESVPIKGLESKGEYIDEVTAEDGTYPANGIHGFMWYVRDRMVNEPPNPPTGLTIPNEIYGGDTITISWNAGTDPEGMPLTYVVVRNTGGDGVTIGTTAELSMQDTIDPSWEKVMYFVRSKDPFGLESTRSASTPYVTIKQRPIAYYNDNGVIKKITECFYNDNGIIKKVTAYYYNDKGTIKKYK